MDSVLWTWSAQLCNDGEISYDDASDSRSAVVERQLGDDVESHTRRIGATLPTQRSLSLSGNGSTRSSTVQDDHDISHSGGLGTQERKCDDHVISQKL